MSPTSYGSAFKRLTALPLARRRTARGIRGLVRRSNHKPLSHAQVRGRAQSAWLPQVEELRSYPPCGSQPSSKRAPRSSTMRSEYVTRDLTLAQIPIAHHQVPPKVEYGLTEWGEALCPALDEILKRAASRDDFMEAAS